MVIKIRGFSLIEVLLAVSALAFIVTALIGGLIYGTQSTALSGDRTRALLLAQEGVEAARSIRNAGFYGLSAGSHGLAVQNSQWKLNGTQDTTGVFARQVTITDEIDNRKKIVSTVTWPQTAQQSGSVAVATYLTAWADQSGPPTQGSWKYPALESIIDLNGGQSGLRVSYRDYPSLSHGYAFLITNSASNNFNVIDLSTVFGPAVHASINLSNGPTDLEIIEAAIPYALVSSRDNSAEFQMVTIEYPNQPALAYSLGLTGSADGLVVTSMTEPDGKITAYLGRAASNDDNFHIIHFVDPAVGPPAPAELGSLKLDGDIKAITFYDSVPNIAFVASSDDTKELQLVDVSDKSNPRLIASADLAGTAAALSLATFTPAGGGIYLLVGQADGQLSVFELFNPTLSSLRLAGSYNAGGAINDIAIKSDQTLAFLATAAHSETQGGQVEFQVITIGNPSAVAEYSSLQLSGVANGIFYDPPSDRNFIANESNTNEFIIIKPGCQTGC